ncbi:MAG: signal peptide peptidase SppA [Peptococcaceae bacterium]|nr:MAG: signal peptide peptidase SppA [Peptococcaceae bacterium]
MKRRLVAGFILGAVVFFLILTVVLLPAARFRTETVAGGGEIGIIHIDGIIAGGKSGGGFLGNQVSSEEITARLREAAKNPRLKAVVIRINSPGGTASASQEISTEVARLKQAGKKVVVSMGDMAASGAYWIAAGADQIVANPATITGSIGVIIETQNMQSLFGKIGLSMETFKSGPHKDMGSPSRPVTPEERVIFQSMIDDIYDQFINVVAKGRGMETAAVKTLADGRVFTGQQAKELGLVDQLGNYYDAVSLAARLAGISGEPQVVELGPRSIWQEFFGNTLSQLVSPGGMGYLNIR